MTENNQIIAMLNSDSEHMIHIANYVKNDLAFTLTRVARELPIKDLDAILRYIKQINPEVYAQIVIPRITK